MQTVFNINYKIDFIAQPLRPQPKPKPAQRFGWLPGLPKGKGQAKKKLCDLCVEKTTFELLNNLNPKTFIFMKESTKKTLKKVAEIVITIITALLTTLGAHAAGIVQ